MSLDPNKFGAEIVVDKESSLAKPKINMSA
jgi:hypothetical protein